MSNFSYDSNLFVLLRKGWHQKEEMKNLSLTDAVVYFDMERKFEYSSDEVKESGIPVSLSYLMEPLNISKMTASRSLEALEKAGLIHMVEKGKGKAASRWHVVPYEALHNDTSEFWKNEHLHQVSESHYTVSVATRGDFRGAVMSVCSLIMGREEIGALIVSCMRDGYHAIEWEGKTIQFQLVPEMAPQQNDPDVPF